MPNCSKQKSSVQDETPQHFTLDACNFSHLPALNSGVMPGAVAKAPLLVGVAAAEKVMAGPAATKHAAPARAQAGG